MAHGVTARYAGVRLAAVHAAPGVWPAGDAAAPDGRTRRPARWVRNVVAVEVGTAVHATGPAGTPAAP